MTELQATVKVLEALGYEVHTVADVNQIIEDMALDHIDELTIKVNEMMKG